MLFGCWLVFASVQMCKFLTQATTQLVFVNIKLFDVGLVCQALNL